MIKLSVVIPVYNEEKRISKNLKKISEFLKQQPYSSEILIIDDGSNDNSKIKIQKSKLRIKNLRLIKYQPNQGKGYAVRKGVLAAKGQYILFSDADLSTPITETEKLLVFIKEYPIVIGSRYLEKNSIKIKQPWIRRVISRFGHFLIRIILGLSFADTQCGFKLFKNKAAKDIFGRATINRWGFDMEILAIARKLNYSVKEVAVIWYNDPHSQLRAGRAAWNTLKELLKIRYNLNNNKYQ